jgi:PhnB protein
MEKQYKPKAYNSVSPYLIVPGAQKMIDFLKSAFGAREMRSYDNPDGSIMHAEVMVDDSVIMLGDASPQYPANRSLIHVYVADVDSVFDKAIRAGATADQTPKQREGDPDRRGSFKDFAGNTWAVATQLPS